MADTASTRSKPQSAERHPALDRLDAFVGNWRTEGEIKPGSSGPSGKLVGTDTYEWLPGRFFLVHRVDVHMGDEKVDSIEIIGGYDPPSQTYPMQSFDHQGNSTVMQARVTEDGVWTFASESMRFTGGFGDGGNIFTGEWQQRDGSKWLPWMTLKLTKKDKGAKT
jgi:hypothetical protein